MTYFRYITVAIIAISMTLVSCDNGDNSTAATPAVADKNTTITKRPAAKTATTTKKPMANDRVENGMEWLSFDEVDQMGSKNDKKYLVDVYTSWCGWCKVMDKQTFTDTEVKDYVGDNFYPVKFDAEQKDPIKFKGKAYEWMPGGRKGINKLAVELLGGRMSYPSLVYLDENMNKIKVSPGFKKPEQLLSELKALETM